MSNTMTPPNSTAIRKAIKGRKTVRPTWEMADYYPRQGEWTESDYLCLPEDGPRAELVDGYLEILPVPSLQHQRIAKVIFKKLDAFVEKHDLGEVLYDGTRVKVKGQFRLPDVVVSLKARAGLHDPLYFSGADLIVEVVSEDAQDRKRDLVDKREEYSNAGIEEYWIVDPKLSQISVLNLTDGSYGIRRDFKPGEKAVSNVLKGFEADVTETLAGFVFPR